MPLIRALTGRPLPASAWLCRVLFPDPERLATLAAHLPREQGEVDAFSHQFSEIVSSIRIGDTWKLTSPRRLQVSMHALAKHLRERPADVVRFLDVGGSDGINTLECARHLETALGKRVEATLLDLYVAIHRYGAGWLREYRMSDGSPVLVRLGPIGVQLSGLQHTRDALARWIGRHYLARMSWRSTLPRSATFSLVNPLVAGDGRVRVREGDALQLHADLTGRFHAVRASNFMNRDYFSSAQMDVILSRMHAYLQPGGLLVISRNHIEADGLEHGTIWVREDERFRRIEDFASGSYVADVVDRFAVGGRAH